ncbi:MAG: endo-1,4-beta-xylanase [Bacilli bacterium]|nr:endo-1,4-beta-xylanase [Bacilli bacterium]
MNLLRDVYADYFSVGAALNPQNRNSTLLKHFSSLTCENAMKWSSVHPADNTYTFEEADEYIKIAKANNIKVRGHALVWHEAIPETVFKEGGEYLTKDEILTKESEHIEEVMKHFGDDVYCWDVLNEVIDDNQSELAEDLSNVYRKSDWYETCGEDFIFNAFETAARVRDELGLKVKLYYNDYSNDTPAKLPKTLAMLKRIKEKNIPIDGIGMQSHYHLGSFDIDQLEKAIKAYAELGLDIQITEFDVNIYDETLPESSNAAYYYYDYASVPENSLRAQTTIYNRAFELFRKYKDNISNVTFWGVSDANTYMNSDKKHVGRTNYPYIFDVFDEPKESFYAITEFDKGGAQ